MKSAGDSLTDFLCEMHIWERNRMYPPTDRKESVMEKLTADHALAIERARLYMSHSIKNQIEPRFKDQIRADLMRLRDVQITVVHLLHHPELLLTKDI